MKVQGLVKPAPGRGVSPNVEGLYKGGHLQLSIQRLNFHHHDRPSSYSGTYENDHEDRESSLRQDLATAIRNGDGRDATSTPPGPGGPDGCARTQPASVNQPAEWRSKL